MTSGLPTPKSDFGGYTVSADDVLENSDKPARSLAARGHAVRLTTAEKLRDPNITSEQLAKALGVEVRTAQRYRQLGTVPKSRLKALNAWHRNLRRRKGYDSSDLESKRDAAAEAKWGKYGTPATIVLNGSAGISGSKRGIKIFRGGQNCEITLDAAAADDLRRAYAGGEIDNLTDVFVQAMDSWFGNSAEKTVGDDFHIDLA